MKALAVLLALTVSAGGALGMRSGSDASEAETLWASVITEVMSAPFVGPCMDDVPCASGKHEMVAGDQFREDNHDCIEPSVHFGPACGVTFHPNEVLTAGATRLAAMLTAPETNVSLNVERNAIQVRGCTGSIIAHLPLRDGTVPAILSDL